MGSERNQRAILAGFSFPSYTKKRGEEREVAVDVNSELNRPGRSTNNEGVWCCSLLLGEESKTAAAEGADRVQRERR